MLTWFSGLLFFSHGFYCLWRPPASLAVKHFTNLTYDRRAQGKNSDGVNCLDNVNIGGTVDNLIDERPGTDIHPII